MKDKFEEMMEWSLGHHWKMMNIKKTPEIWADMHPELPCLQTEHSYSVWQDVVFWIFQMSQFWSVQTGSYLVSEDRNDGPSLRKIFSVICKDFMKIFRRKRKDNTTKKVQQND